MFKLSGGHGTLAPRSWRTHQHKKSLGANSSTRWSLRCAENLTHADPRLVHFDALMFYCRADIVKKAAFYFLPERRLQNDYGDLKIGTLHNFSGVFLLTA